MNHIVSISDDIMQVIDEQVRSGRFANAEDVVRAAVNSLAEKNRSAEPEVEWLRDAWDAGMASGNFAPLGLEMIKSQGRAKLEAAPKST